MKCQILFPGKNKKDISKYSLLKILPRVPSINKIFDWLFQEGKTALYWAVEKGHTEITRLLLDNDPDLEISNKVSGTAGI